MRRRPPEQTARHSPEAPDRPPAIRLFVSQNQARTPTHSSPPLTVSPLPFFVSSLADFILFLSSRGRRGIEPASTPHICCQLLWRHLHPPPLPWPGGSFLTHSSHSSCSTSLLLSLCKPNNQKLAKAGLLLIISIILVPLLREKSRFSSFLCAFAISGQVSVS